MPPSSRAGAGFASGLTLIELMVAMAIFAVMAASMFIAFNNVQTAKEVTERSSDRLKAYQSAFNRIGQDIQQIVPRYIRGEYDDLLGALLYDGDGQIEFTRAGWGRSRFFTKTVRSELQRVQYYLEDGNLMRAYWRTLDRSPGAQPVRTVLLKGVSEFSARFFYQNDLDTTDTLKGVFEQWPPLQIRPSSPPPPSFLGERSLLILPNAIELSFTTDDLGVITRSYLVANGVDQVFK